MHTYDHTYTCIQTHTHTHTFVDTYTIFTTMKKEWGYFFILFQVKYHGCGQSIFIHSKADIFEKPSKKRSSALSLSVRGGGGGGGGVGGVCAPPYFRELYSVYNLYVIHRDVIIIFFFE